jgi:outer membrane protein
MLPKYHLSKSCYNIIFEAYICGMQKLTILFLICTRMTVCAQEKWSLEKCINYAVQHNIQIQQSELNIKLGAIQVQQNKYAQYPFVNADVNNGVSVGRSIDPTSNTFINQGYYFNGLSLGSNVLLFGWFAKKYQRQQSELDLQTNTEQTKQLQNDVSLNIAAGYLRVLLAKEQVKISEAQWSLDNQQYLFTKKRVVAGQLPELNNVQLLAQLAADSSSILNAHLDVKSALIDLKTLLNLDMQTSFEIEEPNINLQQTPNIADYPTAEFIFAKALESRPMIKANMHKTKSAQMQLAIAKTAQYPQLNLGASIGTNYASTVKSITAFNYKGEETIGNIKFSDSLIPITRPSYDYTFATVPLLKQFGNNIRQTLSLGLSVPIFNGYAAKQNIERAKINILNTALQQQQEIITLQQNVFKAYNDAQAAVQKWNAAKISEQANALALDYTIKRYAAGMQSTQEYTSQQNTSNRAKINTILAQYDMIFKLKILDFYLGKQITL